MDPGSPNIIGATGGSGTRVVARIARLAGLYIGAGARLSEYEDARGFGAYSDRWINRYLGHGGSPLPPELREAMMREELQLVLEEHLVDRDGAERWGWKEPRSIYLLPFFHAEWPGLRFLHVIRDGRDMALSENQNQLRRHGRAALGPEWDAVPEPVRSIALWSWVNLGAADYGERELGDRYLRLRFEDLCDRPHEEIPRLLDFFGLEGDVDMLAREVTPPATLGRWREEQEALVSELERVAEDALRRFGYVEAAPVADDDSELAARIASFPRWHYRFTLRGHETPVADEKANRHEQRRRYFFDPLVALCGGSLRGKRVVDLGCNAGFWTLAALRAGADFVLAVDGRPMHIEQARLVLDVQGIDPSRYELLEGDVLELDYQRHGRFDVVLCLGLLYHVDDPIGLLRRVARANDDILVVDTSLSDLPGAALQLSSEPTDDPRNALERELVLLPTRDAVLQLADALGYEAVTLQPAFTSYEGAEDYREGHRRAFILAKRTPLDELRATT